MHIPDGFINAPTCLAAGAFTAACVGRCLHGARSELDERTAPLAGLTAAFVFAAQMINFPVAGGTSGHLLGGTLAAILVGPYTAVLCMAVVLTVQALLFADGGLTALGVNIALMGVVTVLVGHWTFRPAARRFADRPRALAVAAFVSAALSVPVAALGFVAVYAVGGTADVPLGTVAAAMVGVHVLIGLGEGVITAFTVGGVLAVRPDLVHGVRRAMARRAAAAPEPSRV
ncbi:energy-coupling factor ABC transporter permease [Actinomadura gamaensis]|uniref:Energy-coupling factor ABC transporter permease n=1 Tax=Actinomadura gamaensis TaxID=1763541 RepID=A0ABV9TSD7_9ACTN